MALCIKNNTKLAVVKEVTEGLYAAPAAATDFIEVMEDGATISPSREVLEQKVLGLGLAAKKGRLGLASAEGEFKSFLKAGSTAGSAPECDVLLESLFGSKRSKAEATSTTANTASLIKLASTTGFNVGDIVVVKEAGKYHASPIKAVVTDTSIELLIAMDAPPADGVKVAAFLTYVPTNSGHSSFSVSKYVEDAILEQAAGCKCTKLSIENFTTGQLPSLAFSFEGLSFDRSVAAPGYVPSYDTSECPVVVEACAYQDGVKIDINEFSLSIENTIAFVTNTCAGKASSRVTARSVSGSINPYKQNNSVANFDAFNAGSTFSFFIRCFNPTAVAGEGKEYISFYIPKCWVSELSEGDVDGVLTDALSFKATSSDGTPEIYVSFS